MLSLRDACEFLSKKDYLDNWRSEMHETFCFWSLADWRSAVERAGFVVHEVRGADGAVTAYVMAPGRAHVMVWEREPRGGVVVTVTGLSNVPESGGGGGGGGGGAM